MSNKNRNSWGRKPYTATIAEIRKAHEEHDLYMVANQRGILLDENNKLKEEIRQLKEAKAII